MEHPLSNLKAEPTLSAWHRRQVARAIRFVRDELGADLNPLQENAIEELRNVLCAIRYEYGRKSVRNWLASGRNPKQARLLKRALSLYAFLGLKASGRW